jgi:hypothetical protein
MPVHHKSKGYHSGATAYVAGRPGYPPEAETWLREATNALQTLRNVQAHQQPALSESRAAYRLDEDNE